MPSTRKKMLLRLMSMIGVVVAASLLALIPYRPTYRSGVVTNNEVHADVNAWATTIQSGSYDCPLDAVNQAQERHPSVSGARTRAFVDSALGIIRSQSSMRNRVIKAAELAIECRIFFGSCGRSAGAIYALAGISDRDDPAPEPGNSGCMFSDDGCNLSAPIKRSEADDELMAITGADERRVRGRNCHSPSPPRRRDCYASGPQAVMAIQQELMQSMPGWPNKWSDYLEPGDWLYIYNGNSTPIGSHSVIFLGWQNEAIGRAWIFEGNARPWVGHDASYNEQIAETRVRLNTKCLKSGFSECTPWYPVIKVFTPE